jgi:hypothetical protein
MSPTATKPTAPASAPEICVGTVVQDLTALPRALDSRPAQEGQSSSCCWPMPAAPRPRPRRWPRPPRRIPPASSPSPAVPRLALRAAPLSPRLAPAAKAAPVATATATATATEPKKDKARKDKAKKAEAKAGKPKAARPKAAAAT